MVYQVDKGIKEFSEIIDACKELVIQLKNGEKHNGIYADVYIGKHFFYCESKKILRLAIKQYRDLLYHYSHDKLNISDLEQILKEMNE